MAGQYAVLKAAIEAVIKTNGNNEITGALMQQSLLAMITSLGAYYDFVDVATPSTNPGTPDQNVMYFAATAGTYTNFGGIVVNEGEFCALCWSGSWIKKTTGAATAEQVAALGQELEQYPFANSISKSQYDACILDVDIVVGASTNYMVGLHTLSKDGTKYYIRFAALNADGSINSSIGNNGIVALFYNTIPSPAGIVKLNANYVYDNVESASVVVDFSKFPTDSANHASATYPRQLIPAIIYPAKENLTKQNVYNFTPAANEVVWDSLTYFPTLPWLKDFVVKLELNAATPLANPICIGQIRIQKSGRTFITIHKCTKSGNAPNDSASQICLFDRNPWTLPSLDAGGHRFETLPLAEKNRSGVTGTIVVDWAAVPVDWDTLSTFVLYNQFPVLNSLLTSRVFKGTAAISGKQTLSFQIDGVDALLHTSNGYTPDGEPDWLMIICHGNGMGDNLPSALPTAASGNLTWYENHKISMAVIRTQDQETTPYSTNATGWGNKVCIARTIKLYNYLMENFNFKRSVILAGESMGGCTMGALAYKKPFPIAFCLGVGPVPGVEIMFNNSSETYKASIRAAYGMAANGADDADIAEFVAGYDWYKMGFVEISGVKKKIGFPNVYMYYGNDSTFRTNFGGTTQYQEVVDSLLGGGSFSMMAQVGTTDVDGHATTKCFAQAITDGVFADELGIA